MTIQQERDANFKSIDYSHQKKNMLGMQKNISGLKTMDDRMRSPITAQSQTGKP